MKRIILAVLLIMCSFNFAFAESDSELIQEILNSTQKKDTVKVRLLIEKYINRNPEEEFGYSQMGMFLYQLKDYGGAIKSFDKAYSVAPDSFASYRYRGYAKIRLGHYADASKDFKQEIDMLNGVKGPSYYKYDLPKQIKVAELNLYKSNKLMKFEDVFNKSLLFGCANGDIELVQLSISKGASPNAISNEGEEAIYIASENGYPDIVKLLLEKGASANSLIDTKFSTESYAFAGSKATDRTALTVASDKGHLSCVKILLSGGAEIDFPKDFPPLLRISFFGTSKHFITYKYLLDMGANANIQNSAGITPLMALMLDWHPSISDFNDRTIAMFAEELIKHGADVNIKSNDGRTAFSIAMENGFKETVKVLLRATKS